MIDSEVFKMKEITYQNSPDTKITITQSTKMAQPRISIARLEGQENKGFRQVLRLNITETNQLIEVLQECLEKGLNIDD